MTFVPTHVDELPMCPSSMASSLRTAMGFAPGNEREPSKIDVALSVLEPTVIGERASAFLRKLYPSRTADNVAADLRAWRVKSGTISKMLQLQSTPGTWLWIALSCVYGPEFLCAVLDKPPAWLSAAHRSTKQQQLEAKIDALRAELDGLK